MQSHYATGVFMTNVFELLNFQCLSFLSLRHMYMCVCTQTHIHVVLEQLENNLSSYFTFYMKIN